MNDGHAIMTSFAPEGSSVLSSLGTGWAASRLASGPSTETAAEEGDGDPLFLQIRLAELSGALTTMDRSLREARRCGMPVSDRHTRLAADIWAAQRLLRRIAAELCMPRAAR